ncbi:MAG: UDP-N-acetylmuramate--L-alanine ligase [Herpetosiphonaceae bacterium]|nr:MAG: UDP-N-acetylmuramate--L-alanine ligase [Herpetosiphonaceae bacterium]
MRHHSIRHIHILGVGGSGLSAIAHLLLDQGITVSGCDRSLNAATTTLQQRGATIVAGHAEAHLAQADALLVTSAAPVDHPEVRAARERGIPVLTRHDLWSAWSRERPVAAVAGTHGKTTTTGMLAHLLVGSGVACGYLIGAPVAGLGSARWGTGPLVIEADEYARTFLALAPRVALMTNIDWDHIDIFPTQASYDQAFRQFAEVTVAGSGEVVACGDDAGVRRVLAGLSWTSYGLGPENSWRATGLRQEQAVQRFTVERDGQPVAEVVLQVPGEHNVRNALGALAAGALLGVAPAVAARSMTGFRGAARRFEPKGEARGVLVFDDYAHHPEEIRATIRAARTRFPEQRLVVYFQPHTFSRIQAFLADFALALAEADTVRVGAIYAARESHPSISAEQLVALMDHPDARYVGDLESAAADLVTTVCPGDILLTLGAGDGYLVGEHVLAALKGAQEEAMR